LSTRALNSAKAIKKMKTEGSGCMKSGCCDLNISKFNYVLFKASAASYKSTITNMAKLIGFKK